MARVDQLEEQPAATLGQRQVTDLVHDQQRWTGGQPHAVAQVARLLGLAQQLHHFQQRAEVHGEPRLDGCHPLVHREMRLAHARRTAELL